VIKNRLFMLGLGLGLVAGALLLQLMISAGVSEPSREQIIAEAARLNLKVIGADEKLLSQEEWEVLQAGGTGETGNTSELQNSAQPDTSASPAPAVTPKAAAAPDAASNPSPPASPDQAAVKQPDGSHAPAVTMAPTAASGSQDGSISLRVPNGSTLSDVADLLDLAGVIEDRAAFLRAADKRGAAKTIQYGKYIFEKNESLDSVLKKLTTVK